MDTYIAIDIGGTQIRVSVYAEGENRPLKHKRVPTKSGDVAPLDRLLETIAETWPEGHTVRGIGIAAPGPLDPQAGIIYYTPNIPGWEMLPLARIVTERFQAPAALGNDANMAALGEWRFGAGKGHHDLLYLTISTGIGGGVICDDRLLLGAHGLAAELGHTTVVPDGPLCSCGQYGHLEAMSSGTAIARYVTEQLAQGVPSSLSELAHPTGRDISMAAEQGDPLAKAALARAGTYIGYAVADFLHIFNPSIIILGGGVSQSGSFLIEPMRAGIMEKIISPGYVQGLVIATAALGDDSGLLGALALAHQCANA